MYKNRLICFLGRSRRRWQGLSTIEVRSMRKHVPHAARVGAPYTDGTHRGTTGSNEQFCAAKAQASSQSSKIVQHMSKSISKPCIHGDSSEDTYGRETVSLFLLQKGLQRQKQSLKASENVARQIRTSKLVRQQWKQKCLKIHPPV